MPRDAEDLMLQTLRIVIAENTDIPSGNIWLKRPPEEFVMKTDGPNSPVPNPNLFPAIGINTMMGGKFEYNNYGEPYQISNPDGTSTRYESVATFTDTLQISLFTSSRKDQRDYGVQLYLTLLENTAIGLRNDPVPGQYFTVQLLTQKDLPESMPFHQVYVVKVATRVFKEITAPMVNQVEVSYGMEEGTAAERIQVVPWFTTNSSGTVYQNPIN